MNRFERNAGSAPEGGSIPLALLAIIMVSAIIAVLINNTISAQRQVSFDRDFAEALPVADAGVELAQFTLNSNDAKLEHPDGTLYDRADFPMGETTKLMTGDLNGSEFSWSVTRLSEMDWEVESASAAINGTSRRIVAVVQEQPSLTMAAFSDELMLFRGGNRAFSYTSRAGVTQRACTGNGIVGSNERVDFNGSANPGNPCPNRPGNRSADRVDLYDWEDNPGTGTTATRPGGNRCDASGNTNCEEVVTPERVYEAPRLINEKLDLTTQEEIAFIEEAIASCEAAAPGGVLPSYTASTAAGTPVLTPKPNAPEAVRQNDMGLAGGHYCFETVNFDIDTRLAPGASIGNPVIMFVRKDVVIKGQAGKGNPAQVGCSISLCGTGDWGDYPNKFPDAGALRIFVLDGPVSVGNHAKFAGVMYAPGADCSGANSNAQAAIYGSIICRTLANQGGWNFHFDDALTDIGTGEFTVAEWREERPAAAP